MGLLRWIIGVAFPEDVRALRGSPHSRRVQDEVARERPGTSLHDYARSRGLRVMAEGTSPHGMSAALPARSELQANVLQGRLPGGADGIVFHESVEVEVSVTGTWSHDAIHVPGRHTARFDNNPLDPLGLFSDVKPGRLVAPFTVAAALVPEATGLVPRLRVDRGGKFPPYQFGADQPAPGLGECRLSRSEDTDPALVGRWLEGAAGAALRGERPGLDRPEQLQLVFWCGTLIARSLGFIDDPEELDALSGLVSEAAAELRAACAAQARPLSFEVELPAAAWFPEPTSPAATLEERSGFEPPSASPWRPALVALARELRLEVEDARAYHRAFPWIPVPGQAFAVLRGILPGTEAPGRVALHCERPPWMSIVGCDAVLLPAGPDAAETAPRGEPVPERRLRFAVRNGVFAAWRYRERHGDPEEARVLVEDAVALARERQLA